MKVGPELHEHGLNHLRDNPHIAARPETTKSGAPPKSLGAPFVSFLIVAHYESELNVPRATHELSMLNCLRGNIISGQGRKSLELDLFLQGCGTRADN